MEDCAPCGGFRCPMDYKTGIDPATCKSRGDCPWYTPRMPDNSAWAAILLLISVAASRNGMQDISHDICIEKENDDVRNSE